jgi:hypothetical protein
VNAVPTKIVVDSVMLEELKAGISLRDVPKGSPLRGAVAVVEGVAVFVDERLGARRGVVYYSDGTFALFGDWPVVDKGDA